MFLLNALILIAFFCSSDIQRCSGYEFDIFTVIEWSQGEHSSSATGDSRTTICYKTRIIRRQTEKASRRKTEGIQ